MDKESKDNGANDMGPIIDEVMEREQRNRQALSLLLGEQRKQEGHLLAIRAFMGTSLSYVTSVTLQWVADNVRFAGDLPIFKGRVDEISKKVPVDEDTAEEIQQREPDWTRQLPMATYLAARKHHKFPPLLVVGYQPWVYDKKSEKWGADHKAMDDSVTAEPLLESGEYCDLDTSGTQYYALDGQHRLMAILGLKDLLTTGQLSARDKDGHPRKKSVTRDRIIDVIYEQEGGDRESIHERLMGLLEESVGIEIIPAVRMGETWKDALFRLRGVFVDVNERAKRLTLGDTSLLDEYNGFRVVARTVMLRHRLLRGRVERKKSQLGKTSSDFTTVKALIDIAQTYLGAMEEFEGWKHPMFEDKSIGYIRPEVSELVQGTQKLNAYFDALASLPSHIQFIGGKDAAEIREGEEEDNILFRPAVQVAFAKAAAILENDHEASLENLVRELEKREKLGQLKLRERGAPWFGVLWDPLNETMRRHARYQDLCARLFVYLLGGGIADDDLRETLRADFADARVVSDEGGKRKSADADGNTVPEEDVNLPSPWR